MIARRLLLRCGPVALLGLPGLSVAEGGAQGLHGFAHPLPPLAYSERDQIRGLFVDLLKEVCAQQAWSLSLEMQPLARAFRSSDHGRGFVVFPLDRSSERASSYRWVGPVVQRRVRIYKLSRRSDLQFEGLALLGEHRIGVNKGTGTHRKLLDSGLHPDGQLEVASGYGTALRMLLAGRTDFLAMNELALAWHLRQLGLPPETLSAVATLVDEGAYWFGLAPADEALAERLQQALEQMRIDGRLEALKRRYGL